MRTIALNGVLAAALCSAALLIASPASAQGCNCTPAPRVLRHQPVIRYAPPPQQKVCVTLRMSDADWAACQTKSWSLSSRDERIWTQSYRSQVVTICRPYGHPNLGYRGKGTGAHYIARFGAP